MCKHLSIQTLIHIQIKIYTRHIYTQDKHMYTSTSYKLMCTNIFISPKYIYINILCIHKINTQNMYMYTHAQNTFMHIMHNTQENIHRHVKHTCSYMQICIRYICTTHTHTQCTHMHKIKLNFHNIRMYVRTYIV